MVEKYINMEENSRLREPLARPNLPYQAGEKDKEPKRKEEQSTEKPWKYHNYTPLRVSLVDVYQEVCHTEKLSPPPTSDQTQKGGCRIEYCEYHKLYGHSTNKFYYLKNVIERLVREGRLDRYLASRSDDPKKRRRDEGEEQQERPPQTPERHVHMINGGFAGGGISKSSRKRHLKEVYQVGKSIKLPDLPTISFTKEDDEGITPGHDDPVVITIILANANLHRILNDQGSSADILFKSTFDKLGLEERDLKAYPNSLFGLGDTPIQPLGYISLYTTFGKCTRSKTLSIDYIIVDVNLVYNPLIGRTALN
ncbi:uncharacterized protein LOC107641311 [Arachis ipaensis]|uniref:uncharacterized protein LOC107641311 n=1 Tax=Arachis ipaensis TaxID=130454 RepID=UPI0007AF5CDA|nr:uncharacterized protein LOC107641311 [Arachis ipaensis]XP_025653294.1 uncharacterized protein LOC112749247 [Arachis hypogaea]